MNVNEVIATLFRRSAGTQCHPNDHVNLGESFNDTFPTAFHLAACLQSATPHPRLDLEILEKKPPKFHHVLKIGRTHLMDAVPMRLGQEFSGYAKQAERGSTAATRPSRPCSNLPSAAPPSAQA